MSTKRCTFPECSRTHVAQGLCRGHYEQKKAGRPLRPLPAPEARTCRVESCDQLAYVKDLCRRHNREAREGRAFTLPPSSQGTACAVEGCGRTPVSHGLCQTHRSQQRLGQELRPIRHAGPSPIILHADYAEIVLFNLTGKEVARSPIDLRDVPAIQSYRWHISDKKYARSGHRNSILLHRLILAAPDGCEVDHIDGDRLNNRRSNLRLADESQQAQNRVRAGQYSRGVWYQPGLRLPWRTRVTVRGKHFSAGRFATHEEAKVAVSALRTKLMTHNNENREK